MIGNHIDMGKVIHIQPARASIYISVSRFRESGIVSEVIFASVVQGLEIGAVELLVGVVHGAPGFYPQACRPGAAIADMRGDATTPCGKDPTFR